MNAFERFRERYIEHELGDDYGKVNVLAVGYEIPYQYLAEIARLDGRKSWCHVIGEPDPLRPLTGSVDAPRGVVC